MGSGEQPKPWNARRYTRRGRRLAFAFEGATVSAVRIGGDVRLYLNDDFATRIELWMPFMLVRYGQSHVQNPRDSQSLAPMLGLIRSRVIKADADPEGLLEMEFENGMKILAPSDPVDHEWEAWQITDCHGFQVVCAIGGRLAVWQPSTENRRSSRE